MHPSELARAARTRTIGIAILSSLALGALVLGALGLSGDASAIELPRKGARGAPARGPAPRFVAPKAGTPRIGTPGTATSKAGAPNAADPRNAAAISPTRTPAGGTTPAFASRGNRTAPGFNPAAANFRFGQGRSALGARGALAARGTPGARGALTGRGAPGLRSPAEARRMEVAHRADLTAQRSRLPYRPFPGERGFTGVPPAGETRFVGREMVFQVGANVSRQAVDDVARRLGLSTVDAQPSALTGGTLFRFRVADGRQVPDAVRALEAQNLGTAQPNYVFTAQQDAATLAARTKGAEPGQYVVDKLHLGDVHRVATGNNVLVAVVDSQIDNNHPDLAGAIVDQFDAVGHADKPHSHGTGMTGAIAAHRRLMGIAPGAKILAIHAFSSDAAESPQATTQHILAGMEWAIKRGARVINMSFAGPYDPMLQVAMKNARARGVVLIAAAGNAGPSSPPLYPAADPNVIAVTATDANDQVFAQANRGPQVALAAPGVDILEPAPNAGYQLTTGTSVAAAHVSGVAALLIERDPSISVATVEEILTSSARALAPKGRDDQFGWGLVDPTQALLELDAKVARDAVAGPAAPATPAATPPAARAGPISAR
jgi:subtilisin family serine protease